MSSTFPTTSPAKSTPHDPCPVPIHEDPGISSAQVTRWYLVTGPGAKNPGAYMSWNSAEPHCTQISGATSQSYTSSQWKSLEAAWHATCKRGDPHPTSRTVPMVPKASSAQNPPVSPRLPRASTTQNPHVSPRRVAPQRTMPHPGIVPQFVPPASPLVQPESPHVRPESPFVVQGSGRLAYAVRSRPGEGQISDVLGPARDAYHTLQSMSLHPVLVVRRSLTEAVSFVEGDDTHYTVSHRVNAHRLRWIREEHNFYDGEVPPLSPISISISDESDLDLEE
ncbi:hypothetical protein B0H14DRAFT_3863112 [Mycena olivaceomarginata]|nr:hypothetical protein B0H14DRAFT_3863112 [Mycena olivaceomarginata]